MTEQPHISVIIPVCHGGHFLSRALESIARLEFPAGQAEAIVAGDARDREARRAVEQFSTHASIKIRYVPCERHNRSGLLNRACARAAGRILAFTDDDCMVPSNWLSQIEAAMEGEPRIGVLGGCDDLEPRGIAFDRALDWVLNSFLGTGGCRSQSGPGLGKFYPKLWNMAVLGDVVREASLGVDGDDVPRIFDDALEVHEDVDLCHRIEQLGRCVAQAPQIRVRHYRDTTFKSFFRRSLEMARVCRRLGLHRFPHVVLAAILLCGVVGAALIPFYPIAAWVLGSSMALYVLLLLFSGLRAAATTRSARVFLWVPLLLAGAHLSRGVGYLMARPPKRAGDS